MGESEMVDVHTRTKILGFVQPGMPGRTSQPERPFEPVRMHYGPRKPDSREEYDPCLLGIRCRRSRIPYGGMDPVKYLPENRVLPLEMIRERMAGAGMP
jgi:hypothetical protein